MKVSLDGGKTWIDSEKGEFSGEVRVKYELIPEENEDRDLYVTLSEEGIIMDAYSNSGEFAEEDECVGSSSEMAVDAFVRIGGDMSPTA
jgi:hypothetical protein